MTIFKTLFGLSAACSLLVGSAGLAFAQAPECETDADCEDGFACEVTASLSCPGSPPCPEGEECAEPPECEEEEFRECVRAPIDCETDADCPSYLSCVTDEPPTICTVEPGGEEECEEPDREDLSSFCEYVPIDCETDGDCPDDFECISFGQSDCATIACPEGEECPEPECDESEAFACVPRQIECDTDADCPSEWACVTFESGSCSGSGEVAPDDGGEGDSGEGGEGGQDEQEPEREDEDCEVETISACIPPGFEEGIGGGADLAGERQDDSNGDEEGGPTSGDDEPSVDEEDSGCSVAAGQSGGSALFLLLAGLAFVLRRRR